ncbi:MAG: DUF370 domain-containing protein [Clostridia bacterium]|nr:DUF370 domain-containing protein [Clostridia bacterium]
MYTYLGASRSVKTKNIIGLFDMDTATVGTATRGMLAAAQRDGRVDETALDPGDIPRSFVLTDDGVVHLTESSVRTLKYRAENPARVR